jgi:hypothetical protein
MELSPAKQGMANFGGFFISSGEHPPTRVKGVSASDFAIPIRKLSANLDEDLEAIWEMENFSHGIDL